MAKLKPKVAGGRISGKCLTLLVSMVFSILALTAGGVLANGVTSFAINWDVIAGGDGTSSSTNYNVTGTIGQPLIATTYYGAARQLTAGYCYPAAPAGRCLDPQTVFTLDKQADRAIAGGRRGHQLRLYHNQSKYGQYYVPQPL